MAKESSPLFQPYWWNAAPPEALPRPTLERSYDVAIIGAGITGLSAAIPLLRAGKSVVIFDNSDVGAGASRRNAGFLGRVLKKSISQLAAKYGAEAARRIYRELDAAYQETLEFIETEKIACHATRCGRFIGATSKGHLNALEADLQALKDEVGFKFELLSQSDVHKEIATDIFVGGAVVPDLGSLHPGLYHRGLQQLATTLGAVFFGSTEVTRLRKSASGSGTVVGTSIGDVVARDVVVATNGYTTKSLMWHRRRLVPFTGYMAATAQMPTERVRALLPNGRTVLDTKTNIDFFRPSPDNTRILWGGATGGGMRSAEEIGVRMKEILIKTFPQLHDIEATHVWSGQCAGTFDMMPHMGENEGIWYAMGYNFAGVPMGSHMGRKLAAKILGQPGGASSFDDRSFTTVPFYRGNSAWLVPIVMKWFDSRDAALARKAWRH